MLVRDPETGAAVFICRRGERPTCHFPAEVRDVTESSTPTCPTCGMPVDVYESSDGRTLAYRHLR